MCMCIPVLILIVLLTERVGLWHVFATCLFAMSVKTPTNLNEDCVFFVTSSRQLPFLCTDVHTNTNQNLKCRNFDTPLKKYKYRDFLSVRIVYKTVRINFFGNFYIHKHRSVLFYMQAFTNLFIKKADVYYSYCATDFICFLEVERCHQARDQGDASGCSAPSMNLAARNGSSQDIKDKHADQKWAPCRRYHEADPRQKAQLLLYDSANSGRETCNRFTRNDSNITLVRILPYSGSVFTLVSVTVLPISGNPEYSVHCGVCLGSSATGWKADVTWYHPRSILLILITVCTCTIICAGH